VAVSSVQLVPELQSYVNEFLTTNNINKYSTSIPAFITSIYLPSKSFIEMLFNENYSERSYNYLYREITSRYSWPDIVKDRIMIYSQAAKYFTSDTTGNNLFLLQNHDRMLLNALLYYRMDSTSVVIIDSTSDISLTIVGNTATLSGSYNSIQTNLAKLIYLYLDFKIYGRYERYNNDSLISDSNKILECCFEMFLADKIFRYISNKGS